MSINRSSFEFLTKLEKLKLDHNQITYISEGAFNFTNSLRSLYVSYINFIYILFDIYHVMIHIL